MGGRAPSSHAVSVLSVLEEWSAEAYVFPKLVVLHSGCEVDTRLLLTPLCITVYYTAHQTGLRAEVRSGYSPSLAIRARDGWVQAHPDVERQTLEALNLLGLRSSLKSALPDELSPGVVRLDHRTYLSTLDHTPYLGQGGWEDADTRAYLEGVPVEWIEAHRQSQGVEAG